MNLGKKIVIVGVSAVGKSTFARELSTKTKLPLTHMDAVMWKPGWNYVGDDATVRELERASSDNEWIIEGYISKGARQFVFDRADTIIYLDYSPMIAARRYIQRWLRHRKTPRPELEGSPEEFSFKFLKLIWTQGETKSLDMFLADPKYQARIVRLTSPKEAYKFLASLE
jgi:adenylate kinase family enzyme